MRSFLICGLLLLFLWAVGVYAQPASPLLSVYDGFEAPVLSDFWITNLLVPGSYVIESEIVRAGRRALRLTLRPGDNFMSGSNGDADNERDELMESPRVITREGLPYEFSWSMYLPSDFPIVPVRLVVAQWWEYCPEENKQCFNNSPVLAVRYVGGLLTVTQDLNRKFFVLYEEKRDLRGRWLDLRFEVRLTADSSGFVRAWLDGKQVVDYAGASSNITGPTTGFPKPNRFLFRMGLYRNAMSKPMTIYLDEYHKQQMKEDDVKQKSTTGHP
jgi:hypothetical protein